MPLCSKRGPEDADKRPAGAQVTEDLRCSAPGDEVLLYFLGRSNTTYNDHVELLELTCLARAGSCIGESQVMRCPG